MPKGRNTRESEYENTYVFLHSDHGYKLHRDKQFLYEGGINMPLIVAGPGIDGGQVRDDVQRRDERRATRVLRPEETG